MQAVAVALGISARWWSISLPWRRTSASDFSPYFDWGLQHVVTAKARQRERQDRTLLSIRRCSSQFGLPTSCIFDSRARFASVWQTPSRSDGCCREPHRWGQCLEHLSCPHWSFFPTITVLESLFFRFPRIFGVQSQGKGFEYLQ